MTLFVPRHLRILAVTIGYPWISPAIYYSNCQGFEDKEDKDIFYFARVLKVGCFESTSPNVTWNVLFDIAHPAIPVRYKFLHLPAGKNRLEMTPKVGPSSTIRVSVPPPVPKRRNTSQTWTGIY